MSASETPIDREQKAIAESLRLRGAPPKVARLSRSVLIVMGGALSAALAGAIGWSLSDHPQKAPPEPAYQPGPRPEQIASLPKDYLSRGVTPKLGPPLPGDLGRPIVSAQRGPAANSIVGPAELPSSSHSSLTADQVEAAQAARHAARASGLFLATSPKVREATIAAPAAKPSLGDPRLTSPERLADPASPYVLQAGSIIPAALVTGLTSQSTGLAIAQVTQDVYDSLGGGHLLIPAGARLLGEYATATLDGQSRLGVAWTRLILPSGRSLVLDKLPAADLQGMAGLRDGVDRRWRQVWSAAALSTVLAVGAEAGASDEDALTRAVRRGVGQTASDVGQQAVGRGLALTPTLTVRAGAPLRVLLSKDLVLEPYVERSVR